MNTPLSRGFRPIPGEIYCDPCPDKVGQSTTMALISLQILSGMQCRVKEWGEIWPKNRLHFADEERPNRLRRGAPIVEANTGSGSQSDPDAPAETKNKPGNDRASSVLETSPIADCGGLYVQLS